MPKNSKDSKDKSKAAGGTGGHGTSKARPSTDPSALRPGADKAAGGEPTEANGASPKRKLGLRGAAPWAARHAAKHAAEARARAASPPPPGSARATIREPIGAEELKAKISELHNALLQIRSHRKNLSKGFYDVGLVLREVQQNKLYEAKGYGSFEAFLEREIDLGKTMGLRLVRIATTFQREAALEHGLERLIAALQPLDATSETMPKAAPIPFTSSGPAVASRIALPMKPPLGRVG